METPVVSYFTVVRRYWKLLSAIALIPTIIMAIIAMFVMTPVYQGKTSIILPLQRSSSLLRRSLSDLNVPISSMSSLLDTSPTLYNHIAIIESRNLAIRVYNYMLNEKGIDLVETYPDIARKTNLTQDEKVLKLSGRLRKKVKIDDTDRGLGVITFLHTDPVIAAEVANAYVNQTLVFLNDVNRATQSDLVTFLGARQNEVDESLKKAELDIQKAKEETGILFTEENARNLIGRYGDIEALVAQSEINYRGTLSHVKGLEESGLEMKGYASWMALGTEPGEAPPVPSVDALSDATIEKLRSQLGDLEVSRQQTMLWATEDNPEVAILNREIESVRKELYREYANYYDAEVATLMVESASYQAQLDVSQGILDELDKKIQEFPPEERRLVELERDRDVYESIYYVVTQELEQARIQELREETPFTVLDEAIVPNKPVLPRKLMIILGTFALSFWLGIFAIFVADSLRRSKETAFGR